MDCKDLKRVTIFAGHYGSGKTNVAINYALWIKSVGISVDIADLDIVNPYFRTKDAEELLLNQGINLVSSSMANTNVDTPALPAQAYSIVHDTSKHAVIDVGGDDRGALALGRYVPFLLKEKNYEFLFVINKYRFLTASPEETIEVMKEIELAAGMSFTGIVNNSNIGDETTSQEVLASVEYSETISKLTGLPIKFTSVKDNLYNHLKDKICNLMSLKICVRQSF